MTRRDPAIDGPALSAVDRPPLLVLGASVRAACGSARRAGFAPIGVDLFADRDLAALGPAHRVEADDYPDGLARVASALPEAPWVFTGALENRPDLVDRIAATRPLLGISGDALRAVRDPIRWTAALTRAGLAHLESRVEGDAPPASGDWVVKPIRSASGRGVRPWTVGSGLIPAGAYLQERATGRPLGAVFVRDGTRTTLAGLTRQLLGATDGLRSLYRGSLGPWPVSGSVRRSIREVGDAIGSAFDLSGLYEVDLILNGALAYPVEINPRYSASVEVLERAFGFDLIGRHARAFGVEIGMEPTRAIGPSRPIAIVGKLVLLAGRDAVGPDAWPWADPATDPPEVADLPAPGVGLPRGSPALTVFAEGETIGSTWRRLRARARTWRRRVATWAVDPGSLRSGR